MEIVCQACQKQIVFDQDDAPGFCQWCGVPLEWKQVAKKNGQSLPADPDEQSAATIAPCKRPVPRSPEPPGRGQVVGPYELTRWLGSGGMGVVWEAVEKDSGRRVALKCLSRNMVSDPQYVQRFIREAQLAARISHPKVTFIFGSGEHKGLPYIAMELMPGSTLGDVIKANGPMEVHDAVDAIIDVAEGLSAAHRMGMIHRDVKPSNCFLAEDESVKVGDFGLSKSIRHSEVSLTQSGTFMGTPSFSAPEQIRGGELDGRTDVYAVGATLFNLLTGRTPFVGDALNVTAQIVSDEPTMPRSLNAKIPRDLEAVILKCLEKEPSRRFQDLDRLKTALVPFASRGTSLAHFGRRIAAYMTDYLLIQVIATVITLIMVAIYMQGFTEESLERLQKASPRFAFWSTLGTWLLMVAYFTYSEGWFGRTLGKRFMGLKLVDANGELPGIWLALSRSLAIPGLFGVSMMFGLYQTTAGNWSADAASQIFIRINRLLVMLIPLGICVATMRMSNRFRGLHGFLSGTRVVRQVQDAGRRIHIPVVQPTANTIQTLQFGPYQANEMLGEMKWGHVYLGRDSSLHRDVWVIVSKGDTKPSVDRINLARNGRQRWLAGGECELGRWDALQAINGVPLQTLVGCRFAGWNEYRSLLLQLAEELQLSMDDGTLPPQLSLPQVWIDENMHVKLLDRRLVTLVGESTPSLQFHKPTQSREFEAVQLFQEAANLLNRTQVFPRSAYAFLKELEAKPARAATLEWATEQLESMQDRLAEIDWDTRAGIVGVTLGFEFITFCGVALCIFLPCLSFIESSFVPSFLFGLATSMLLPVVFGFWFRGGAIFNAMDINVCELNGKLASRSKCAMRSFIAWLPVIMTTGLATAFSILLSQRGDAANAPGNPMAQVVESNGNVLLGLAVCFVAALTLSIVGAVAAIRSPKRGLQDRMLRTQLIPD